MLLTKFQVNWSFSSGDKCKIDFEDGDHLGFLIRRSLVIFYLQVTQCFLLSFKSTGLSVQEEKRKIDFPDGGPGGHLGFPIGMI